MSANAKGQDGFQELILDDRSGESGIIYIPQNVSAEELLKELIKLKEVDKQLTVRLPFQLNPDLKDNVHSFRQKCRMKESTETISASEATLDMRNVIEMKNSQVGDTLTTVSTNLNIYTTMPKLIQHKPNNFKVKSSVIHLQLQNEILRIESSSIDNGSTLESKRRINLTFSSDQIPFEVF